MARFVMILLLGLLLRTPALSQNSDSAVIKKFFDQALDDTTSYHNLRILCTQIGGRICGSPQAEEAVQWTRSVLEKIGLDTVYLQKCMVRHWVRGNDEEVIVNPGKKDNLALHGCALGGSVGTGQEGIKAPVVEVKDFDELKSLGRKNIEGKIVFFNHPADPTFYNTFRAYGGAAEYRFYGAIRAAWYGAVAVVVRSATTAYDWYPHTGIMGYADTVQKIPAAAISTRDADLLSSRIKKGSSMNLFIRLSCKEEPETGSYNVIGEIRGTEHPEEVIVFGGHLDSWDTGQGANDDGSGVVQTIEVLRLFKALGIKPKRTIRVVAFMDEEMAQRGAAVYAREAIADTVGSRQSEVGSRQSAVGSTQGPVPRAQYPAPIRHIAAIECDRGGATPFGFSIDASDAQLARIQGWKSLFLPYGLYLFDKGGSGVDIKGLKTLGIPLVGLVTDPQRYFDYHHSPNDTFDKVNQRELQLGSAAVGGLVYLIDKYGF